MPRRPRKLALIDENSPVHNNLTRLQFGCMSRFWDQPLGWVMPIDDGLMIDQRPFDSLARRGYLEFVASRRGFKCTHFGWRIKSGLDESHNDVLKDHYAKRFGSYLRNQFQALSGNYTETSHGIVRVMTRAVGGRASNVRVLKAAS